VKDGWKRWIFDTVPKGNLMQAGKTPVLGGKNRHTVCRFWLAVPSQHHEESDHVVDVRFRTTISEGKAMAMLGRPVAAEAR
jgi:hypothetical protein